MDYYPQCLPPLKGDFTGYTPVLLHPYFLLNNNFAFQRFHPFHNLADLKNPRSGEHFGYSPNVLSISEPISVNICPVLSNDCIMDALDAEDALFEDTSPPDEDFFIQRLHVPASKANDLCCDTSLAMISIIDTPKLIAVSPCPETSVSIVETHDTVPESLSVCKQENLIADISDRFDDILQLKIEDYRALAAIFVAHWCYGNLKKHADESLLKCVNKTMAFYRVRGWMKYPYPITRYSKYLSFSLDNLTYDDMYKKWTTST